MNRSARTERETPDELAPAVRPSTPRVGSPCSAASACPTTGSRNPGEPAGLGGRQRLEVVGGSPRRTSAPTGAPGRSRRPRARCPTPARRCSAASPSHPVVACVACRREVDDRRQRREQRIVRTLVAAEEAADDRARARGRRRRARRPAAAASIGRANIDMSGAARMPGRARQDVRVALREHDEIALVADGSAPGRRRVPQHAPRAIRWYSMTRWAPGITVAAISRDGGASATHGELSSKSKYTAPVRRTARSTSERTSVVTHTLHAPDARASVPDARGRSSRHSDGRQDESDAGAWL